MYDQPEPPRRVGPLLLVVLLVLGGVGGTMGYLVTRQVLANNAGPTNGATGTRTPDPTGTGGAPTGGTTPGNGSTASAKDESTVCPDVTAKALTDAGLNGKLTVLLYVEVTLPRGKARGWVCRNEAGVLVYQGHELSGPLDKAFNGRNTIILAKGVSGEVVEEGGGYKATNTSTDGKTTDYIVAKNTFRIVQSSGGTTTGQVTRFYTP